MKKMERKEIQQIYSYLLNADIEDCQLFFEVGRFNVVNDGRTVTFTTSARLRYWLSCLFNGSSDGEDLFYAVRSAIETRDFSLKSHLYSFRDCRVIPVENISERRELQNTVLIHVCNKGLPSADYIKRFCRISGEVCFSSPEDNLLSVHDAKWGIVMEGRPTAEFDCDVWSWTYYSGKRIASSSGNSSRKEFWAIPEECKIIGLFANKQAREIFNFNRITKILGINLFKLSQVKYL